MANDSYFSFENKVKYEYSQNNQKRNGKAENPQPDI